jgi:hypothetical protein
LTGGRLLGLSIDHRRSKLGFDFPILHYSNTPFRIIKSFSKDIGALATAEGEAPGPPSDEEMAGVSAMDVGEAPPPDDVELGGLAAMETEVAPPPPDVEVSEVEKETSGKKTGRTAKSKRKKT